ncbi:MAG: hypothetical protein IJ628_01130 [Bacteroidaceae bacterium]|nr:hypothetical protein [Bacteroidaceae bacterium]
MSGNRYNRHLGNVYYLGKFGKWSIDFNADLLIIGRTKYKGTGAGNDMKNRL